MVLLVSNGEVEVKETLSPSLIVHYVFKFY